jgi:predicted esterase
VCRGARDDWYSSATFEQDQARLRDAAVSLTAVEFDGKHEWSQAVMLSASRFLAERLG